MSITSITHSFSTRVAAGAVGIAMAMTLIGVATPVSAQSTGTAQVAAVTTSPGCPYTFSLALHKGSNNADVMHLQQILNWSSATQVASSGSGSPGMETTYFGAKTKAAVIAFQNKYASTILAPIGLTSGTGLVGAATRAQLNSMCGGTSTTGGTTSTGGGTVATGPGITISAANQPANSLAPQNAARVPFTTFTLTNNTSSSVTVNSITIQRTGLAQDASFSGIVLLDSNGVQVGISHTLNSNHQAN